MLWVPKKGILRVQHNMGTTGTTTIGSQCTTGGAAATKGTVVEVFASTTFDTYWIDISASHYGLAATASEGALDIMIGAATEEVLIPNLLMGYCGGGLLTLGCGAKNWRFPLYIPAGSRIGVRAAGARVSTAIRTSIYLYGGDGHPPWRVGRKVTTYGMGTVPNGTAITPGASGAEGSFAQIVAATTEDHFALVPSFQASADATINLRRFFVDIGLGAATEEEVLQSAVFGTDSGEMMEGPYNAMPAFHDVPSGTRLAMRASNSGTNDGGYNGVIHAVS